MREVHKDGSRGPWLDPGAPADERNQNNSLARKLADGIDMIETLQGEIEVILTSNEYPIATFRVDWINKELGKIVQALIS